ncbi:acyl-CoA dehydrogenase family protein [Actinopolymorpha singaporensis]|uniref:Acyl-CoA dehydrogenase n=1 Tax=Actinopolymorpha singaporensis TaxID=117157 RepID=A0A1H1T0T7_9ACTN|nr:acyl-CoA dehydrogenase family protein [Actinopolymorpha singaporensis]SDS53877.1 Acyl-CoA dehydrogenase [Actinopolymorpha singaporensis]
MTADATTGSPLLRAAHELAADLLAPNAAEVDNTTVPRSHLDALGRAGLLGLAAPVAAGGSAAPPRLQRRIQEVLAGADAATWFVGAQHHGPVRLLADSDVPARAELLPRLARGELVAGTAFAHLRRWPDRPVEAERVAGGWRFSGVAPWYTGWELNDVFSLGGATADGEVVFGIVPARPADGLVASEPLRLAAMTATRTVRLRFTGLFVPDSHVVARVPVDRWLHTDRRNTVMPNPAAFGLVETAVRRLREVAEQTGLTPAAQAADRFAERLDQLRVRTDRLFDDVPPDDQHDLRLATRAQVGTLLMDATTALVVAGGGRSMTLTDPAQRLAREAAFLLVQAQTRPAREEQLRYWADGGAGAPADGGSDGPAGHLGTAPTGAGDVGGST